MFAVGSIETTHMQWTVGEFTYAYMRVLGAAKDRDYIISHAGAESFKLYLPPRKIPLSVQFSEPVPVRVSVMHCMGIRPEDMTVEGFAIVAKTILLDCSRELAARCPRRASCLCVSGMVNNRYACGLAGKRPEFRMEGMIANAPLN